MKKFNKVIKIEVPVDAIANKLLDTLDNEFKHRELVAEAIIATALDSDRLTPIYNALNGFTNEIDFKVGDEIICESEVYQYPTQEDIDLGNSRRCPIGHASVLEIDEYRRGDKLKISYNHHTKQGVEGKKIWVDHLECSKIKGPKPVGKIKLEA